MKFSFAIVLVISAFYIFSSNIYASDLVINEFAPNSDSEWVEFYNASDSAEFIKSYYIDDKSDGGKAKQILTDLNTDNPHYPYFILGNGYLNNNGDDIILTDSTGNVIDQYHFGSVPTIDRTIGRTPEKTGNFAFLESSTKGTVNSGPRIDPTPTPSPSLTPTPTASPSLSPSAKPTARPSITPPVLVFATDSPEELLSSPQVLGQSYDFAQASATARPEYSGGSSKTAIILMLAGMGSIGVALFPFLKRALNRYQQSL